jgi:membrane protease YdiL (CAAX protease family)
MQVSRSATATTPSASCANHCETTESPHGKTRDREACVFDLVFLIILVLFFVTGSVVDIRTFRKLRGVAIGENTRLRFFRKLQGIVLDENTRLRLYRGSILSGWLSALIPILFLLVTHRNIGEIGLRLPAFSPDGINRVFAVIVLIIAAALLALMLYQIIGCLCSTKYKSAADAQIREQIEAERAAGKCFLSLIIPATVREKRAFAFLSLTAGICEELTIRGLLFCLLYSLFPALSAYIILVITSVFFGALHAYQGVSGAVKTSLLGIALGALYLATGSLIPGILLHFIMDLSSTFVLDPNKPNESTI